MAGRSEDGDSGLDATVAAPATGAAPATAAGPAAAFDATHAAEPTSAAVAAPGAATAAAAFPVVARDAYELLGEHARGGLGRILRARDRRTGRLVAIKEMLGSSHEVERRFAREALLTANLQHPSIVPVYELGRWPSGDPFYAMKLVAGRAFDETLAAATSLDRRLALLPTVVNVAEALAYAHGERIVHRDLKPANVLTGAFGETVVIDWGLAKRVAEPGGGGGGGDDAGDGDDDAGDGGEPDLALPAAAADGQTIAGAVMGTPAYMPPEQAVGEEVDARADVYALGAILYHLLAGHAPYHDLRPRDAAQLLGLVAARPPTPLAVVAPGAPRDLVAIAEKAMQREPADRYASARELAEDLRRFTTGQLVGAHRYDRWTLVRRWLRRYRAAVTVAAVFLVVLGVTAAVSVRRIIAERERAEHEERRARRGLAAALAQKGAAAEGERAWGRSAMFYLAALQHDDSPAVRFAAGRAEARTIPPVARHVGHAAWVHAAAVTGGDAITVDEAGGVRRWSLADGRLVVAWTAPAPLRAVAVSPDGAAIAVGGDDGVIRVLDAALAPRAELPGHDGRIWSVAFAPDGRRLASAGEDATVRVWDLATGDARVLAGHAQRVYAVEFAPDGARLVSASDDRTSRVWDLATGDARVLADEAGGGGGVRAAVFAAGGDRVVAVAWDWSVQLWDARTGRRIALWHDTASLHDAAVAPDGRLVATGGDSATVKLWDPTTQRLAAVLEGHDGQVTTVAFSADGRWLVSAGRDAIPRVWDLGAASRLAGGLGHQANVVAMMFARDGRHLVTSASDRTIRLWDLADGVERRRASPPAPCHRGAFVVGAGAGFGSVCEDGNGYLYDAADGQLVRTFTGTGRWLSHAAVGPDDRWLAAGHVDGWMHVWELATGELRVQGPTHDHNVYGIQALPDGTLLTASLDNTVRRWDPQLAPLGVWRVPGTDGVMTVAQDPRGRFIVAGGNGFALYRWTLPDGEVASLAGHTGSIWWVDVSPDGSLVASASSDGTVRLWDTTTWTSTALRGPPGVVATAAFSPDGRLLASGHERGAVILWDVATRAPVRRLGAAEAGEQLGCDALDRASWHDADERAIVERACAEPPAAAYRRLAARTHLVLVGDVDLVEQWR